jgi:undecaprenyl-diphosphatase
MFMTDFSIFEGGFLLFLQEYVRQPYLNIFFKTITHLGDSGIIWIVLCLLLLISKRHRKEGMGVLVALVIGFVVTNLLLKNLVARPRPYTLLQELTILVNRPSDFSFPSGHACSSFAAALTMFRLSNKRIGVPALLLAVLIAFSRLYVGVHFPSDVMVGALIGVAASCIAVWVIRKSKNYERNN